MEKSMRSFFGLSHDGSSWESLIDMNRESVTVFSHTSESRKEQFAVISIS